MTDDLERLKARIIDAGLDAADAMNEALARIEALQADNARLRAAMTALHKQALMLRGDQSYREFARAVEKQARAALTGKEPSHE